MIRRRYSQPISLKAPDLRQVSDLVALEGHHVHVVGTDALPCRRAGAAFPGMRPKEDCIGANVFAFSVDAPRLEVVARVRHERIEPFHPIDAAGGIHKTACVGSVASGNWPVSLWAGTVGAGGACCLSLSISASSWVRVVSVS